MIARAYVAAAVAALGFCGPGCVVVYAPKADRLSVYEHQQHAGFMDIRQDIQPRIADRLAGMVGAEISGNSVASPTFRDNGVKISPSKGVGR